jgi:hypothetical protein
VNVGPSRESDTFFADFEGFALGMPGEILGLDGARFSTSPPGGFLIFLSGGFTTVTDQILATNIGPSPMPLTVAFDSRRRGASFGWVTAGTNGVSVTAYRSGVAVLSKNFTGTFGGFFYEGTATVPTSFDSLVIEDLGGIALAFDNLKAPAY